MLSPIEKKPRTRRCKRCKEILQDDDEGRYCPACWEVICPNCVECGEPVASDDDPKTGICYRCEPGSDYWIQEHLAELEDDV